MPEKAPEPQRDAAGFRCGCHQGTEVRENVSGGVAAVSGWGTAVSEQICVSIDSSVQIKKRMPRTGNQSVRGMFFLSSAYVSLGHLTHMLCAVLP